MIENASVAMKHGHFLDKVCLRVRHGSCPTLTDTDTCNYTEICDFLKNLAVSACRVRIRAS